MNKGAPHVFEHIPKGRILGKFSHPRCKWDAAIGRCALVMTTSGGILPGGEVIADASM